MKFNNVFNKAVQKITDIVSGTGVSQDSNTATGKKAAQKGMPYITREAAIESAVLLKNDNSVLPIDKAETVSVFGRCQRDWFYVGYGSGGDVNEPYTVNLIEGLKNNNIKINESLASDYEKWCNDNPINHGFWGHWPMSYPERPIDKNFVTEHQGTSNTAVVVIGRAAGEDRENLLKKGSYYLTDYELQMLDSVTAVFDKVVVLLNCSNIIDMSWLNKYGDKIQAVLYVWQCGSESGNAVGALLNGKSTPSGKLADTIALDYSYYPSAAHFGSKKYNNYTEDIFVGYRYFETFCPEKVLFPFGYGLSYTKFNIQPLAHKQIYDDYYIGINVKNVGKCKGKEVVQLYVEAPQGKLGKAKRSLVSFAKTPQLEPGESKYIEFKVNEYDFASFDDTGITGNKNAYVLEKGKYIFHVGNSVRCTQPAAEFDIEYKIIEQLEEVCPVKDSFDRMVATEINGRIEKRYQTLEPSNLDLAQRIKDNLPSAVGYKGYRSQMLGAVESGKISMDDFISGLTNRELEALTRGQGFMNSPLGAPGNAGAFGGILPSLRNKGVPPIITTDGPAGIRLQAYTSLIPCGTALACTWNLELVETLTYILSIEMRQKGSDVLLAPGMNIHRDVLCGRNFEYFSEDPFLTGFMAASYVSGIQQHKGSAACPKHFACNNQETARTKTDSRVSQRALREIYLKGFEICVKRSHPLCIMTSYNKINGVWSHYNYDLATTVLRKEWKYDSVVITDWWMQKSESPEFPQIRDNAYRVRAQVDVLMPGGKRGAKKYESDGTLLESYGKPDGITRGELERTAKSVLDLAIKLK